MKTESPDQKVIHVFAIVDTAASTSSSNLDTGQATVVWFPAFYLRSSQCSKPVKFNSTMMSLMRRLRHETRCNI